MNRPKIPSFTLSDISRQVALICDSSGFAHSKNNQAFLKRIVKMRMAGAHREDYKSTVLNAELFPRATSDMAKQVGFQIKLHLQTYYQTDGREDPIVIRIDSGLMPEIVPNAGEYRGLSSAAARYCLNASTALEQRAVSGYQAAIDFLKLALDEHPNHPVPLSLLAQVHISRAMYSRHAPTELAEARRRISAVRDQHACPWQCWLADACLTGTLEFDWDTVRKFFNRAIELYDPAKYHPWHTAFLASEGDVKEALRLRQQIVDDSALHASAIAQGDLAMMLIIDEKYEDAERVIDATIALMGNHHYLPYLHRALLYEAQEKYERAVHAIDQVPTQAPESFITMGLRFTMYGLNGDLLRAREGFATLRDLKSSSNPKVYVPASQVGMAALGMGDKNEAVRWIMEAVLVEHDPILMWLNVLPHLRYLHDNYGFRQLLERINRQLLERPNAASPSFA